MPAIADRTDQRFGRLVAKEIVGRHKNRQMLWRCICDCGNEAVVETMKLANGNTKSCGCWRRDFARALPHDRQLVHGHASRSVGLTAEYTTWRSMRNRCYREKDVSFRHYGGRGIKVCDRWNNSFPNFLADMGRKPSPQHSLDRIDNDGNYEPGNCRWALATTQGRNRRTNKYVTVRGETVTIKEAWERFARPGLLLATYYSRLWLGWSIDDALSR